MNRKTRIFAAVLCGAALAGAASWAGQGREQTVPSAQQQDAAAHDGLMAAARVDALMQIVATEGARHGMGLEAALFPGEGGESWARRVSAIQAPARLTHHLAEALRQELSAEDARAARRFLAGPIGARVVAREVEARRDMLDSDTVAEAERVAAGQAESPREALIAEMIAALDLVTINVTGGMNANYAFYRGLGDGGGLREGMTDADVLAIVRAQEEEIRASVGAWLHNYLSLAYAPLTDAELRGYLEFTRSAPGRRYMAAMFQGFGRVFEATSYELGRAAAEFMTHEDV